MPQAIYTFLEEYDFFGKTIIPFATHGGNGARSSVEEIMEKDEVVCYNYEKIQRILLLN